MTEPGIPRAAEEKRRIAVLCDGHDLTAWQAAALRTLGDDYEIFYLVADGVPAPRRQLPKHAFYYALNIAAIKRAAGKRVAFSPPPAAAGRTCRFSPEWDGAWAVLPPDVLAWLADNRIEAVLKFALSLLRIPDEAPPILSYHHGDPAQYRGRPAGYYEVRDHAPFVGQIVQRLNNTVDAGQILALAHTRVYRHSYRRTLADAYSLSPFLLRPALARLFAGEQLDHPTTGKNYRLPSNASVLGVTWSMGAAMLARLWYGLFFEKRWNVSRAPLDATDPVIEATRALEGEAQQTALPLPSQFSFLADPFFYDDDTILVEALDKKSGKGRLAAARAGHVTPLQIDESVHLSYPAKIREGEEDYVVPEMASAEQTGIFQLKGGKLERVGDLKVAEGAIVDPTFLKHEGHLYLFGNLRDECPNVMRLWVSNSLFAEFTEHPQSPIRVSVRGGRMGGGIISTPDGLIRPGQDFERSYGDALLLFRIAEISPERYREEEIGRIAFSALSGPHTLDLRNGQAVFDWYRERFSLFAGVRRILAKL